MKKFHENRTSNKIRDINNFSKQKINNNNNLKVNKKIQTECKNNIIISNIISGSNYNYLQQTSSSLNKNRKKSSEKKIKDINKNKNNYLIKAYPRDENYNMNYNRIKRSTDSLSNKEKINNQKNNYNGNNIKVSKTSQNFYEYFPQPEPLPKTINYNFNINNNLKYKTDYSNSKDSTIANSTFNNKKEDNNILYLLMNLNLGNLYNTFISNCISFHDLFLLTKDDFIEMKIPIGPRNRIIHFIREYKKSGKNFDFMELSSFLNYYKKLIGKPNINEINFDETFQFKKNLIEDNKNSYQDNNNINNKGILLLNSKCSDSSIKLINNIKVKENNIQRLKKYNSFNFNAVKENKNNENNHNGIKTKHLKEKLNENKTCLIKRILKNNSFKNSNINNKTQNKKSNYDFLYQKFKDVNKKVIDFQQNFSKIKKCSNFFDEKISKFLKPKKFS